MKDDRTRQAMMRYQTERFWWIVGAPVRTLWGFWQECRESPPSLSQEGKNFLRDFFLPEDPDDVIFHYGGRTGSSGPAELPGVGFHRLVSTLDPGRSASAPTYSPISWRGRFFFSKRTALLTVLKKYSSTVNHGDSLISPHPCLPAGRLALSQREREKIQSALLFKSKTFNHFFKHLFVSRGAIGF